jgi:hypothetical protein
MKEILRRKMNGHFSQSFNCFATRSLLNNCQRELVDELGMIKTQIGTQNRSEMVAVHGTPCAIPPCNSNTVEGVPY